MLKPHANRIRRPKHHVSVNRHCLAHSMQMPALSSAQPVLQPTYKRSSPGIKDSVKNPTAPNANAPNNPTPTASIAASQPATSKATSTPSGATVTGANQQSTTNGTQGPWFSTHWRWVVMLIVLAIGLTLIGVVGTIWHRRYHRKREARFAGTLGLPNINTWGPGQSVHDLGFTNGSAAPYQEKGKAKVQTRRINEPAPARMREMVSDDKI